MIYLRASVVVVLLVAWRSAVGLSADDGVQPEPTSALDVLVAVRQIADDRSMARDDLYTQEALRRLFGTLPEIAIEQRDGIDREASVFGYGSLADWPDPRLPQRFNGIFISLGKYLWPRGSIDGATICYMQASFRGFASGMDFEHVVARLGPGWRRDQRAEQDKFNAWARELSNPPFPAATAPMSNTIIEYGQGDRRFTLESALRAFWPRSMLPGYHVELFRARGSSASLQRPSGAPTPPAMSDDVKHHEVVDERQVR